MIHLTIACRVSDEISGLAMGLGSLGFCMCAFRPAFGAITAEKQMYLGDLQPFAFAQGLSRLHDLGRIKLNHSPAFLAGKVIVRRLWGCLKVSVILSQSMIFH